MNPRKSARSAAPIFAALGLSITAASCAGASGSATPNGASGGESTKPAGKIVTDAKQAMQRLRSFHLSGDVNQSGQVIKFDLVLSQTVGGGTMSLGGANFQVIDDGSSAFVMGDEAFWKEVGKADDSVAALLAGKWVTGFSGQDLQQLAQLANAKSLITSLTSGESTKAAKGATVRFSGREAIPLRSEDGSTGYVAATGPPYILGVQGPSGQGEVLFDEFNTARPPDVPRDAVNFNDLTG